jgi:hypothetical protein
MTSVTEVVKKGEGKILANFREIPALSKSLVENIMADFKKAGIGGALSIGNVGNPLCQVNVDISKVGMILVGGLNPVAAAAEQGIDVENRAMSTVMEYEALRHIEEF